MTNIESKLNDLRVQWTKYPEKRPTIELQSKVLKMKAREEDIENDKLLHRVRNTLL